MAMDSDCNGCKPESTTATEAYKGTQTMIATIVISAVITLLILFDVFVNKVRVNLFIPWLIAIAIVWAFYGLFRLLYWAIVQNYLAGLV